MPNRVSKVRRVCQVCSDHALYFVAVHISVPTISAAGLNGIQDALHKPCYRV